MDLGGGSALAVFNHGNVRRTEDGGLTWQDIGEVLHSLVTGNEANGRARWAWQGPDGRLYVGGSSLSAEGFGYTWRTVEPLLVADEPPPSAHGTFGVTVRPNPSPAGAVTVEIFQASPAALAVEVYDALGRRVAVLHQGTALRSESGAGSSARSLPVDTSGWAPGVYSVRVATDGALASETFTVVR